MITTCCFSMKTRINIVYSAINTILFLLTLKKRCDIIVKLQKRMMYIGG